MKIIKWEELPHNMQNEAVRKYYDTLHKKKQSLFFKRLFDIVASLIILVISLPLFIIVSIIICIDSKGGPFFKQERVTQYCKRFRIIKFRTMVTNSEPNALSITTGSDTRITKIGKFLRKTRIDEVPQAINILKGEMTFVSTRPEINKYVDKYTDEMMATLLLPAGVTSEASIVYKDEGRLLDETSNPEDIYIEQILPVKMIYNLAYLEDYSFANDIYTILRTALAVGGVRVDLAKKTLLSEKISGASMLKKDIES